jgi:hypothetical protein
MNIRTSKWTLLPTVVLLASTTALAQDPSPGTPSKPGEIRERKENQQDRIANGVKSGQLTAGETSKLETKEAAINSETRADRAAGGGKLTAAEKQQINRQQNQLSKQIYTDKHNANTASYGNNPVGQRRENQQDRIAQGIKSGQLTAGEASNLEHKEAAINREVRNDRAANGGKLTPQERRQVNRQQNHVSNQIYNKKHNGRKQ